MINFEVCSKYINSKEVIDIPTRATASSAGYDFHNTSQTVYIPPQTSVMIQTGIKVKMDPSVVMMLFIRSSMALGGLRLTNQVGIIDADYYNNPKNEGEIGISLYNSTNGIIIIEPHQRIAQGVFLPYFIADDDATNTMRNGGFGSTGV